MRYSTEIIQYTLHIFLMDSFALKTHTHTQYLKINNKKPHYYFYYLGNELFYDEEQVCPDL